MKYKSILKLILFWGLLFVLFGILIAQPAFLLRIFDIDFSNTLTLMWNEDRAANQTFNIITGAGDRTLNMAANLTVESTSLVNQDLTTDFSPIWVTAKLTALTDGYVPYHVTDATGLANSPIYTDGIDVTFGNSIYVPRYIIHTGDADTYIDFQIDRTTFVAGAIEFIDCRNTVQDYITLGGPTDIDTRLWGGSGFIFIQGSDGYIGINDITPTVPFDINANTAITGTLGVGTQTVPHGGVGAARFAIEGTNANAAGPHIQLTTATDDYPLIGIYPWTHDGMSVTFDAYTADYTTWRSSDAGSNFRIVKGATADIFAIQYDLGIAQGGAITWKNGITLNTSGYVGVGGIASATGVLMLTQNSDTFTITGNGTDFIYTLVGASHHIFQNPIYSTTVVAAGQGIGYVTGVTTGMFIYQGNGEDDKAFQIKNSDVGHSGGAYGTNSFFSIEKVNAATGGALLRGWTETIVGQVVHGGGMSDDTNKTDIASAPVEIWASNIISGSAASVGADGNLLVIRNHFGANTARFIFDEDGDMYYDGAAPANYDAFDDAAACFDVQRVLYNWDRPQEKQLMDFKKYHVSDLISMGIISEGGFVSTKRMTSLILGAIGQLDDKDKWQVQRIEALEARIAYLESLVLGENK